MEWIADCHLKSNGEQDEAAKWFEAAGKASLERKEMSQVERKRKALSDFEKAVKACENGNDIAVIKRITKLNFLITSNVGWQTKRILFPTPK
ncbi:MAG: hypothetical protein ACREBS_04315 [Nitrososphaerales archaeon]